MNDHPYYPSSSSNHAGSSRQVANPAPPSKKPQPPRPPNAWILFRSDVARNMAKGAGAPQQSQVSKTISQLWKEAPPAVKAEYEQRAEIKKQEHAEKYPDYRFQPVKKEDKERLKEEKKASREASRGPSRRARSTAHRYAPYDNASPATPASAAHSPTVYPNPVASYYPGAANYQIHGAFGPTPPMSAASSPTSSPGTPQSPQLEASASQLSLPTVPEPQDFSPRIDDNNTLDALHTFDFLSPASETAFAPSPYTAAPSPAHDWNLAPQSIAPGFLTLNVPASAVPADQSWATPVFDQTLQGLVANTDNPSIFTLSGFDPDTITPTGQIDLSVQNYVFDPSLFEGFDFSLFNAEPEANERVYSNGSNAPQFDLDQYLNLEQVGIDPYLVAPQLPSPAATEVSSRQPYQPPAGAANASTRRVGGSWRHYRVPSPGPPSPLPYGVHAS